MVSTSKTRHKWALWILFDLLIFGVFAYLAWRYFPNQKQTAEQLNNMLRILHGELPYVTIAAEYPPLTYLFYFIPALFFRSLVSYYAAYMVELLLFDLLAVWLIVKISTRLGISTAGSMVIHAMLIVAVGPIIVASYDIIPAVMTLVALYFFLEERNNWAWTFAGLGFMTKIFPAVIVPFFVIYLWRRKEYKQIFYGVAILIALVAALSIPWLVLNMKGYSIVLIYELQRGLHSETIYGSILLLGKVLGVGKLGGIYNYGSWNLTSPLADILAQLSFYVTIALLLFGYFQYWRNSREKETTSDAANILKFSAVSIFLLIVSGKVLSMQYLVWLIPLLPFVRGRWQISVIAAFAVAGIFSQFIYPYNYQLFENFSPPVIILMLFRNILLVACAVMLLLPREKTLMVNS
jgi:hypothetical protein